MALTFRCEPEERHLPMAQRSVLWVLDGDKKIGMVAADSSLDQEASAGRNQGQAIWKARLLHSHFSPFEHHDKPHDTEPHVEQDDSGYSMLVNPKSVDMSTARQWVRDNYNAGST
mgnify:CR=1 FL=1